MSENLGLALAMLTEMMESSSESESDSNDSEGMLDVLLNDSEYTETSLLSSIMGKRRNETGREKNFFYEIVPTYTEAEFLQHFRITKDLFEQLCKKFELDQTFASLRPDKCSSTALHLAVFLWFASNRACSFRDLAHIFDISISTVYRLIDRTTMFLSNLTAEVIKWPNEDKQKQSNEFFRSKSAFSRAIGCINITHIKIDPPKMSEDDFVDRRGNFSLVLQAICDEKRKFIDVFAGYPGSSKESLILKNSPIYQKLETLCGDYYLLATFAYPCTKNVLTPYRNDSDLTQAQLEFNAQLESNRVFIDHTFNMLKKRFPQLYYCKLRGTEKLSHFIRACCVLHNLSDEDDFDFSFELDQQECSSSEFIDDEQSTTGTSIREAICKEIQLQKQ